MIPELTAIWTEVRTRKIISFFSPSNELFAYSKLYKIKCTEKSPLKPFIFLDFYFQPDTDRVNSMIDRCFSKYFTLMNCE